ncbi:hypothetical protein Rsub_08198 [Raphidocelis subcapitata]|uniref:TraB domain-containing protein n=1 Tax=Raphidocelis subcapitata TaxID=307507 RepID=A0A2V0P9Y9_9CHLO|nr:hypothetical protein Rsub_08198 [Raphidocelis subcapitata]|eukprot:GBF95762.1 hypothetical protein Rsub_08198 [Raphidocelis subcapitata]
MPDTLRLVKASWPQLLDLVEEGVLVVHERPAGYVERRADGYREPQLVFLLGTAHVSAKSAEDVRRVVAAVRPECVVVELCRSRTALLYDGTQQQEGQQGQQQQQGQQHPGGRDAAAEGSFEEQRGEAEGAATPGAAAAPPPPRQPPLVNPLSLSGGGFAEAMARTLSQGGQSGLVLRLLLASQARRAAERLGVRAGAEFAAAGAAADAVGAQLVLGDRPVEITLRRAWDALGWRRRGALLGDLLRGALAPLPPELSAELIESLKRDGAVSALFAQLGERYPELVAPLVDERDLYLAWSLKRSKAVNGSRCVVGVVGKGHMRGVVYALRHDSGSLRFSDLVGGANQKRRRQRQQLIRLAVELLLGGVAWALWVHFSGGSGDV